MGCVAINTNLRNNEMTLREKIQVMQAFERGEEIEASFLEYGILEDETDPNWSWTYYEYRIKPKPKQVVVIEKWLCEYCGGYVVVDGNDLNFMRNEMFKKVKLLDTYEVEL